MTGTVKRSFSTPNVLQGTVAIVDGVSGYPSADKRRNKLGYHRTSVACGHCRRRKIRCLQSKDDALGRCLNCIRLKKECQFYPVDSGDRRPRSMSKVEGGIGRQGPGSANSSPSPGHGGEVSHFHLAVMDASRGFTASLPVTPTTEYSSSFDESFRKASIGGPPKRGRPPGSRSTEVSRRPSLAQMHAMPLAMKLKETGLLRSMEGLPGNVQWEAVPAAGALPSAVSTSLSGSEFTDPSTNFWRLGHGTNPLAFTTPQQATESFRPFAPFENTPDVDSPWASQLSSRVGSVDNGIGTGYHLEGMYTTSPEYPQAPPGLCSGSANTSTASLTAALSEASSVYGSESQHSPEGQRYYLSQWATQPAYPVEIPVKREDFETSMESSVPMFSDETRYSSLGDDTAFPFRSPNHSPLSSV